MIYMITTVTNGTIILQSNLPENTEDKMSNRTRQNNEGAGRKMESNDSLDIPDRGEGEGRAWPT